jgi:tetratricopeptide (TPR) repeat protein
LFALVLAACDSAPSDQAAEWGGPCEFDIGDPERQIVDCTTMIETSARGVNLARYYELRAQAHAALNHNDEAIADLSQAISRDRHNLQHYSNRAGIFERLGKHELALADSDMALSLAPDSAPLLNGACWYRATSGRDLDQAEGLCTRAIAINDAGPYRDSRGLARFKQGRFAEALADYDVALTRDPQSAHYLFGRALCLKRLGRDAESHAAAAQARALDPAIEQAYAGYGATL